MQGKIVKGIAGFYYVDAAESGIYECRARGIFRKDGRKLMVGDNVTIEPLQNEPGEGSIKELLPRKNELLRPFVSNVDCAVVIFAAKSPMPDRNLLDRFLVMMEYRKIPAVICFNKADLDPEGAETLAFVYREAGYRVIIASALQKTGIDELQNVLKGHTSTFAGPSGVGKSSIVNLLQNNVFMETGSISEKIERGKHTTRHSELIRIAGQTYIMDTPGFSSLYLDFIEPEEIRECFPEFRREESGCRFAGCMHIEEPDCAVRKAFAEGRIDKDRYSSYVEMYTSRKERRRY